MAIYITLRDIGSSPCKYIITVARYQSDETRSAVINATMYRSHSEHAWCFYCFDKFESGLFTSLWPSDATWRHRSESTLHRVMTCCLTAPSCRT